MTNANKTMPVADLRSFAAQVCSPDVSCSSRRPVLHSFAHMCSCIYEEEKPYVESIHLLPSSLKAGIMPTYWPNHNLLAVRSCVVLKSGGLTNYSGYSDGPSPVLDWSILQLLEAV